MKCDNFSEIKLAMMNNYVCSFVGRTTLTVSLKTEGLSDLALLKKKGSK